MQINASFRDLKVWQRSMTVVEEIYLVTNTFPRAEQFGLRAQIRRASRSHAEWPNRIDGDTSGIGLRPYVRCRLAATGYHLPATSDFQRTRTVADLVELHA